MAKKWINLDDLGIDWYDEEKYPQQIETQVQPEEVYRYYDPPEDASLRDHNNPKHRVVGVSTPELDAWEFLQWLAEQPDQTTTKSNRVINNELGWPKQPNNFRMKVVLNLLIVSGHIKYFNVRRRPSHPAGRRIELVSADFQY